MGCGCSISRIRPEIISLSDRPVQGSSQNDTVDDLLNLAATIQKVIQGDVTVECPAEARVVRIFVSSTFTDTRHERNWLMEKVYPKLKTFCHEHNYDFQFVDMRWGIRGEAEDDHRATEICLNEIQLCKELSTGPCFVSLMSHKYGYRVFPRSILVEEFDKLIASVQNTEAKELLKRWFKLDENSVPPTYVLMPISSQIPDINSTIKELKEDAQTIWRRQSSIMQSALAQSARVSLDPSRLKQYIQSVSEAEVWKGLNKTSRERLVWFRRIFSDIDKVDQVKEFDTLRRYKDTTGNAEKDQESQELLKRLEDKTLAENIPPENVFSYEVNWEANKGMSPDSNPIHQDYLTRLCEDAEERLTSLCKRAFNQQALMNQRDHLFQEALHHMIFCQRKIEAFQGRDDSLKIIENYLRGPTTHPFVIHGPSGCGKTSLVAMAAKLCYDIHGGESINIIRFIGTTPESTTLPTLLSSVFRQLQKAAMLKEKPPDPSTVNAEEMADHLFSVLEKVADSYPIVLLLDSLDQFDPSHGARQLAWLPSRLPGNVKAILSTLPEPQYEAFPALQAKLKDIPGCILEVPELNQADIRKILVQSLKGAGRILTKDQMCSLLKEIQRCPLPLYLQLSLDEARKWKSYTTPGWDILQPTIRHSINRLFMQLEVVHGKVFVSRVLGYLTLSERGLSETELEDILSCDNSVLADVYVFWEPPVRRLPPLLLIRLKRDLGDYLVNRSADNKQVFYWYHRQFIEAAREKYCSDTETVKELHGGLAHFFAGTWGDGKPKPFLDSDGQELSADRHVTSQPLRLGNEFNTRKLGNQAFHMNKSDNQVLLKTECLLNLDFLSAKIESLGVGSLLNDFQDARSSFPGDLAIEGVGEAVHVCQSSVAFEVKLLPIKLVGRIINTQIGSIPEVTTLLASCGSLDFNDSQNDELNIRRLGNQAYHMNRAHNLDLLKSGCLLNLDFLKAKIEALGIRSLLDDFDDARLTFPGDLALKAVGEALQLSQTAVSCDIRLLPSQLLGRITDEEICSLPEIKDLLASCESPGGTYLAPSRHVLEASGGMLVHSIGEHTVYITAMVVNKAGSQAVTCDTERIVKIYNTTLGKVTKTIYGMAGTNKLELANDSTTLITNPKDRLDAHDLATGVKKWSMEFLSKDSQFIVGGPNFSLVLTIQGRSITLFSVKDGSQVGNTSQVPDAIPGDINFNTDMPSVGCERYMVTVETSRKTLFVFDADGRKLSHYKNILKIVNAEKDYNDFDSAVDGLAISPDGNKLYISDSRHQSIYLVDTATLIIKNLFKGISPYRYYKLHVSNDGKYIYFTSFDSVCVLDLNTGKRARVLERPDMPEILDVFTPDLNTFITRNNDRTLKIWNLSRSNNSTLDFHDLGKENATSTEDSNLLDIFPIEPTGRYFLAHYTKDSYGKQILAVFDTITQRYQFMGTWSCMDFSNQMKHIRPAGDWKVSFNWDRRCHVLDLRTMKVNCMVQGRAPPIRCECHLVNYSKELATMALDRRSIKIIDMQTGKIASTLRKAYDEQIYSLVANKTGSRLVADCLGSIVVFDVIKRCVVLDIASRQVEDIEQHFNSDDTIPDEERKSLVDLATTFREVNQWAMGYNSHVAISDDGKYLLFTAQTEILLKTQVNPTAFAVTFIHVYDIAKESLLHLLKDPDEYKFRAKSPSKDRRVGAEGLHLLDRRRLVSTHYDFVVRIWDFVTAALLQKLSGHTSFVSVSVCPGSNILVTNGRGEDDSIIRLWDTTTWKCIALYSCDSVVTDVQLLNAGSSMLIGRIQADRHPIMFELKGRGSYSVQSKAEKDASPFPAQIFGDNVEINLLRTYNEIGETDEDVD